MLTQLSSAQRNATHCCRLQLDRWWHGIDGKSAVHTIGLWYGCELFVLFAHTQRHTRPQNGSTFYYIVISLISVIFMLIGIWNHFDDFPIFFLSYSRKSLIHSISLLAFILYVLLLFAWYFILLILSLAWILKWSTLTLYKAPIIFSLSIFLNGTS